MLKPYFKFIVPVLILLIIESVSAMGTTPPVTPELDTVVLEQDVEENLPTTKVVVENLSEAVTEAPLGSIEETEAVEQQVEEEVQVVVQTPAKIGRYETRYNDSFRKYTKMYLPMHSWHLLAAQCYQESLLQPDAVSPVGAMGLCQFMPGTWKDVSRQLKFPEDATAFDPDFAVMAAAYYNYRLRKTWKAERPEFDRMNLVFASYNAGSGHLINAQKLCFAAKKNGDDHLQCNLHSDIEAFLHLITGHHSKETKTYVRRIRRWEKELLILQP